MEPQAGEGVEIPMVQMVRFRMLCAVMTFLCAVPACVDTHRLPQLAPYESDYYPPAARRLGEEGRVLVGFHLDLHGRLTADPTVVESDGNVRLNEGGLRLVKALPSRLHAPYDFKPDPKRLYRVTVIYCLNPESKCDRFFPYPDTVPIVVRAAPIPYNNTWTIHPDLPPCGAPGSHCNAWMEADLEVAQKRWTQSNTVDYEFTYTYHSTYPLVGCEQAFRVRVTKGIPSAPEDCASMLKDFGTVPALFQYLREQINGSVPVRELVITYDEKMGFPRSVQVDWLSFEITSFKAESVATQDHR